MATQKVKYKENDELRIQGKQEEPIKHAKRQKSLFQL